LRAGFLASGAEVGASVLTLSERPGRLQGDFAAWTRASGEQTALRKV